MARLLATVTIFYTLFALPVSGQAGEWHLDIPGEIFIGEAFPFRVASPQPLEAVMVNWLGREAALPVSGGRRRLAIGMPAGHGRPGPKGRKPDCDLGAAGRRT